MAEFIFRKMVEEAGLGSEYEISSSATSTEEIGNPPYPPARRILAEHGISTDGKFAVQLSPTDADKYDMFIGMDAANIRNISRILGKSAEGKIYKMMSFADEVGDVADPWYTGDFERTYSDIYRASAALLNYLKK